jgi:hypothetical protein
MKRPPRLLKENGSVRKAVDSLKIDVQMRRMRICRCADEKIECNVQICRDVQMCKKYELNNIVYAPCRHLHIAHLHICTFE